MAATRYVGNHTKLALRWEPAGHHTPKWVDGNYKVSFNSNGKKMDSVILHVFKGPHTPGTKSVGRTREDLGLALSEMATPHGFDIAAKWAMENLLSGSMETPHWRYGRARDAAREMWRDVEQHGDAIRRRK